MNDLVHTKLGEAKLLFQKLVSESEKFITPEPKAFGRCLKNFLVEAEGVRDLLKDKGYVRQAWGTKEDRDFLKFMCKQRGAEVHAGGSAKTIITEWVPFSKMPSHLARGFDASFSMPLGTEPPTLPSAELNSSSTAC